MSTDDHFFNVHLSLLDRPAQYYAFGLSFTNKHLYYIHHEKVIHSIPFHRIIRIQPDQQQSNSFILSVVGSRLGESEAVMHTMNDEYDRDGLVALIQQHCTPDRPPLIPSFFPPISSILHASAATKKGKWGGDAQRHMVLFAGRLCLHRTASSSLPLTVIMVSGITHCEKKSKKKIRLCGHEREYELGLDEEVMRDEWVRLIEMEIHQHKRRGEEWRLKFITRQLEEAQQERIREEQERAQLEQQRQQQQQQQSLLLSTTHSHSPLSPRITQSISAKPKRKTMPSSTFSQISAQAMLSRNKRGSLSIATRHSTAGTASHDPHSRSPYPQGISLSGTSSASPASSASRADTEVSPMPPYTPVTPRIPLTASNQPPPMYTTSNNSTATLTNNSNNQVYRSPSASISASSTIAAQTIPSNMLRVLSSTSPVHTTTHAPSNGLSASSSSFSSPSSALAALSLDPSNNKSALEEEHKSLTHHYTIYLKGSEDEPLGQIEIHNESQFKSLVDLRLAIQEELDDVPDDFSFLVNMGNNIPIGRNQEVKKLLIQIPSGSIIIKARGGLTSQRSSVSSTMTKEEGGRGSISAIIPAHSDIAQEEIIEQIQ